MTSIRVAANDILLSVILAFSGGATTALAEHLLLLRAYLHKMRRGKKKMKPSIFL